MFDDPSESMRVIAYLRVSTQQQADSGHGLDAQRHAIYHWGEAMGFTIIDWVVDEGVSAGTLDRIGLSDALRRVRRGDCDGIVVSKLDRLTRSLVDLAMLMDEDWALISVQEAMDTSTAGGQLVANVLTAVSQWERAVISERTRAALAAKKKRGERLGVAPVYEFDRKQRNRIIEWVSYGWSLAEIAHHLSVSVSVVRRVLREERDAGKWDGQYHTKTRVRPSS